MSLRRIMIYSRYERWWHWLQVLAILALLATGFRIHGSYGWIPFQTAVLIHSATAIGLLVLWAFSFFWLITSGTWRHFTPTRKGMWQIIRFYAYGIFKGEHHPYRKSFWRKHNPLQAVTYLALYSFIFPAIWISGLLYLYYAVGGIWPFGLNFPKGLAFVHVTAAFAMLLFVIVHVYMLTIDKGFIESVKTMLNGFDEVDLTPVEEAYLEADEPGEIKPGTSREGRKR